MMLCLMVVLLALSDMVLGKVAVSEDEYTFFYYGIAWEQAEFTCQQLNRTLVNIKSPKEQKKLNDFLDNFESQKRNRWIGLRRVETSNNTGLGWTDENNKTDVKRFAWTDGSVAEYTNWAPSQSNFGENRTRECVYSNAENRKWYMSFCLTKGVAQFICQKRTVAVLQIGPSVGKFDLKIIQKTGQVKVYTQSSGQEIKAFTITDGTHTIHGLTRIEYIVSGKIEDCIAMCQRTNSCSRYAYTSYGVDNWNDAGGSAFCMMYSS